MTARGTESHVIQVETVHDVVSAIRRLADMTDLSRRRYGEHLGLRNTELLAMGHLYRAGSLQPRDLSEKLRLSPGATTALIDRLQGAGFVERDQHPVDRRSVIVSLTPPGVRAIESVTNSVETLVRERIEKLERATGLTAADVERFLELSSELATALGEAGTDLPEFQSAARQVG
jgi:DNA-binding MarR family transcriptional regulator